MNDELVFEYQTEKWGKEAAFEVKSTPVGDGIVEVEAQLVDADGTRCLDSRVFVYLDIAGDGKLIQNQGTSCVAVKADNVQTSFVMVK